MLFHSVTNSKGNKTRASEGKVSLFRRDNIHKNKNKTITSIFDKRITHYIYVREKNVRE